LYSNWAGVHGARTPRASKKNKKSTSNQAPAAKQEDVLNDPKLIHMPLDAKASTEEPENQHKDDPEVTIGSDDSDEGETVSDEDHDTSMETIESDNGKEGANTGSVLVCYIR